ncbi:MAG: carboxymuconolactone decarboxylase family protein [Deltaproteobacteria bacterium]|nr:carboxymuconolactone decarboxylase family protein [Deltaproteobacteria bacterium]
MTAATPSPRIAALTPPFAPELDAMLKKWMPPGSAVPPLALFRTLAVHPELSSRMRPLGAALLGHGLLSARERELCIQRTCARAGAEYEWGVHAVAFGAAVGLSEAQLAATARGRADDPAWTPREQLLLALADELHDSATVSAALWTRLAAEWTPPQLLELLVLAGWYRTLAYVINAIGIELEPWAARFPAPGSDPG